MKKMSKNKNPHKTMNTNTWKKNKQKIKNHEYKHMKKMSKK